MNKQDILSILAHDLGMIIPAHHRTTAQTAAAARLSHLIDVAEAEIKKEGHSIDVSSANATDAQLVIMYSSWLYKKRNTSEGMPKALRYLLNNAIFADKTKPELKEQESEPEPEQEPEQTEEPEQEPEEG